MNIPCPECGIDLPCSLHAAGVAAALAEAANESDEALDLLADWEQLVTALATAQRVVDEQANDEGLWFTARTASEAYLQRELRRLHAVIEGGTFGDRGERLCAGIVDGNTATKEYLIASGMSEADATKVLAFRDRLRRAEGR